jgi:hypothetical protein
MALILAGQVVTSVHARRSRPQPRPSRPLLA